MLRGMNAMLRDRALSSILDPLLNPPSSTPLQLPGIIAHYDRYGIPVLCPGPHPVDRLRLDRRAGAAGVRAVRRRAAVVAADLGDLQRLLCRVVSPPCVVDHAAGDRRGVHRLTVDQAAGRGRRDPADD